MSENGRSLILHVGSPKCGSTYLQRVMIANRTTLEGHGIRYPEPPGAHPGNATGLHKLDGEGLTRLFGNARTLILSHEDLFAIGPRMEHLRGICDGLGVELRIVAFLRPFSEFIYGDYSQFLKQHLDRYLAEGVAYEGMSFEEFAVHRRGLITPVGWLKAWQRVSGEPILVAHHRNIRAVLEEVLGDMPLQWEIDRATANPSLRVSDCEDIAAAIAAGVPKGKVREMFRLAFAKVGLSDAGRTAERSRWIEALFKSQTDSLQAEFGFDNRLAA